MTENKQDRGVAVVTGAVAGIGRGAAVRLARGGFAVACIDVQDPAPAVEAVRAAGGAMLVTADHGNAETMVDPATGQPHTAHTLNPVPVMLVEAARPGRNAAIALRDGRLADVAPTLLELLGLEQPPEMTGSSLIVHADDAHARG